MHKDISFVMPVLNEEKYLEAAVKSVFSQKVEGDMELVLALGPSLDATNTVAKKLSEQYGNQLQLIEVAMANTSAQLNAAIKMSRFEVVLRVDAHAELSTDYARTALEVLNQTGAGNVGGMMKAVGESDFQSAVAYGYNNRIGLGGGAFHVGAKAGPQESVYLGVFDKQKLNEVGGFDARWVRGQDWELNQRLIAAGHKVWFDPRLQVTYRPRSSWQALAQQFFRTGSWRGSLTRENPGQSAARYWVPPLLVLSLVFVVPFWIYLGVIALAAITAKGVSTGSRLWLMVVLPTMHMAWGAGFWLGLIRGAK
jgi:glycosyltransferase involved in cell wall biosynthesis